MTEVRVIARASIVVRPIPGFEDYGVAPDGRIMRITRGHHTKPGKTIAHQVQLYDRAGKRRYLRVDRLVREAFGS